METNYIIILDYSLGELIRIKLTPEEIEESEKYDDFEIPTLEEKYEFRLKDCLWMTTGTYTFSAVLDSEWNVTNGKRNLAMVSLSFFISPMVADRNHIPMKMPLKSI